MLHGMADELKRMAVKRGMRLREYVPVGEMIPGMAYLVRRLLENTSNESWLRGIVHGHDLSKRTAAVTAWRRQRNGPRCHCRIAEGPERHALSPAVEGVGDGRPFFTEPMRDFSDSAQRAQFDADIAQATVPKVAIDATRTRCRCRHGPRQ